MLCLIQTRERSGSLASKQLNLKFQLLLFVNHYFRLQKILADNSSKKNLTEFVRKELPKYEDSIRNLDSLEGRCIENKRGLNLRIGEKDQNEGEDEIRNID